MNIVNKNIKNIKKKGIIESEPISASCILGNNKIICVLEKNSNEENSFYEKEFSEFFNIIIDIDESNLKNFNKKLIENFIYKILE
jgi:hypothetical protein